WLLPAACLTVAACGRAVPDDTAQGVGFGSYSQYQQGRIAAQAQLDGVPARETVLPPQVAGDPLAARAEAAIAAAEAGTTPPPQAAPPAPPLQTAAVSPAAPPPASSGAISDEQDFDAVSARETIETDAERLARMQAARVEVAPTAVPDRPGSTGPNIVEFALATSHPVGTPVYSRFLPPSANRAAANCAVFQSNDLAQQAFLAAGGPERDRRGLDPDGDGYACDWDPSIFRNAARGG
ncbi:MAG: hypothetical protein AAF914_10740, partial [Pseudomonadota bacterium]